MYGTAPIRPRERPGRRVLVWLLRIVLLAVPWISLGALSWVPPLRVALVTRRLRDWIVFAVVLVGCTAAIAIVLASPENADDWRANTGVSMLFALAAFACAYFLVADVRRFDPPPPPWPGAPQAGPWPPTTPWPRPPAPPSVPPPYPAPPPSGRLGQVRAELDELSDYLRDGDRP